MPAISPTTISFLRALSQNNNREWMHAHKDFYQQARHEFALFIKDLIQAVDEFYPLGPLQPKNCIYRQQRDIRFSKDKTPYTTHMSALIAPGGKKYTQVPFYLRIKPDGESIIGAGVWNCSAQQLHSIRQEIDYNPQPLKEAIQTPSFRKYFGDIQGESLKRPPKGYEADHPDIGLIKKKEFWLEHIITEKEYCSDNFLAYVLEVFQTAKPLADYINQALEITE